MREITDWRGRQIRVARSSGGVTAVANPWDNLIATGIRPWPPPEIIQKIYQSRQVRAFRDVEQSTATEELGFYSDLQSLHSEDAITWSVFGPVIYAPASVRAAFVRELLALIDIDASEKAHVWLWRRLPHPDTLVPGGPEIDFGIQTEDVFLLGEAKWRSAIGRAQGVNRDKDQLVLRREFCEKYGRKLLPNVRRFVVLGVSWKGGLVPRADTEAEGVMLHSRDVTWEAVVGLGSHPCADELRGYLRWKIENTKAGQE
jgi:hypothetical protein